MAIALDDVTFQRTTFDTVDGLNVPLIGNALLKQVIVRK